MARFAILNQWALSGTTNGGFFDISLLTNLIMI